jgi:hypothetical protein
MDKFVSYLDENKWLILFVIFGILISYSLGKKYALTSQTAINNTVIEPEKVAENFIVDKTKTSAIKCNKKRCDDMACGVRKVPKKISKPSPKKSPKPSPKKDNPCRSNKYMCMEDIEKIYISKDDVIKNYISRRELDKNYIPKHMCRSETSEKQVEKYFIIPRDVSPNEKKKSPKKRSPILKNSETKILLNKQQELLDKNALDYKDNFMKVDTPACNAKTCGINGYPNGLIAVN